MPTAADDLRERLNVYLATQRITGRPKPLTGGYDGTLWKVGNQVVRADQRHPADVTWVLTTVSRLRSHGAPVPTVNPNSIVDLDGWVFSTSTYLPIRPQRVPPEQLMGAVAATSHAAAAMGSVPTRPHQRRGTVGYPVDSPLGVWWQHWLDRQTPSIMHGDLHTDNVWDTRHGALIGDWWEARPGSLRFDAAALAFEIIFESGGHRPNVNQRDVDDLFALYCQTAGEPDPQPGERAALTACWLWRRLQWGRLPHTESARLQPVLDVCFTRALRRAHLTRTA